MQLYRHWQKFAETIIWGEKWRRTQSIQQKYRLGSLSYLILFSNVIFRFNAQNYFQTTSEHNYSAYHTEGSGTFLSSTVTHHLSGKLTKCCPQLCLCNCWTVKHLLQRKAQVKSEKLNKKDFVSTLNFTIENQIIHDQNHLPSWPHLLKMYWAFLNLSSLSRELLLSTGKNLFKQHNLSGSRKSSICFFQHVSSWRGKAGWEQAVQKKGLPESRAFTEFRFCVPTADTAEQTHKLMGGGKSHFNH